MRKGLQPRNEEINLKLNEERYCKNTLYNYYSTEVYLYLHNYTETLYTPNSVHG